ncbi:MAG: hypothetical protein U9N59_12775 [Campylobacterota bacterium]|nr:hypothetical protein [Campylobacterota bacterium]
MYSGKIYTKEKDENLKLKTWGNIRKTLFTIIIFINFVFSFLTLQDNYKQNDVNCNSDDAIQLINQIMKPILEDEFANQLLKEENHLYPSMYQLIQNIPVDTIKEKENNVIIRAYNKSKAKAKEVFDNVAFSLSDVRTTKKDNELNLVECSSTLLMSKLIWNIQLTIKFN